MANVGSKGVVRYEETFVADNIGTSGADGLAWVNSSDGGDTAFARAVAAARGLHVAGALAATQNNLVEFCGDLTQFYGQNGFCAVEVMLQLDVVTPVAINFGFNDDSLDAGNTLPIELSGTTWTTTATTAIMLVYDTDATNDEWHCMWVDDDSDASDAIADLRLKGAAPVASKWMHLRVEMQDRGAGKGVRVTFTVKQDGKTFEKVFDTTVDRDAALCWYLGVEARTASPSAVNAYVKLPAWEQSIAD